MLKLLSCDCGSAEPLLRQELRKAKISNWMEIPIYKGKEHCAAILSHFPESLKSLLAFQALVDYIPTRSSYAIVVGYNDDTFYWSDIHSASPADVIQAQAIIERFA